MEEMKEPYFFQNTYTDSILFAFSKIRDTRTTAIERKYCEDALPHQGIYMDIFPLDARYDDEESNIQMIEKEIWNSIVNPGLIEKIIQTPQYPSALTKDILQALLQMPLQQRMQQFEGFLAGQFEGGEEVELITSVFLGVRRRLKKSWYDETCYLPFEHLTIPVPAGYHEILTQKYGDYQVFRPGGGGHQGILMDPDRSYLEYYREWGLLEDNKV
jgi:lipopolysaccharide cholinephosphotransferase